MKNLTAVIVCRKGSVRIPNKAWQLIGSVSLLERKILQLKKTKSVDRIVVGSDDEKVRDLCLKNETDFFLRPVEFCDEISKTPNDMIRNMLGFFESDTVLWAHITNPFIDETIYTDAIDRYFKNLEHGYDSLFSASILKDHFWNMDKKPLNHDPYSDVHILSKDLRPVFKQNGGIFIRDYNQMIEDGRFVGDKPFMFEMNEIQGWDINYPWELDTARLLSKDE